MMGRAAFLGSDAFINQGQVTEKSIDVIQWDLTLDDGTRLHWESEARYDTYDLYEGRTPSLTVDGVASTFDEAVEFGRRLGFITQWLAAESAVK